MSGLAVVIAGGCAGPQVVPEEVAAADVVVAADSGLDAARRLGIGVDLVVGDLDSVSNDALAWAHDHGIAVEASPADKDQTDLELAIEAAVGGGIDRLVVLGGAGGRLDHLLANLSVLCGPLTRGAAVEAWVGRAHVWVVRDRVLLNEAAGSVVSLLAWHGDATGVTTLGMRWPLRRAVLRAGSALGTSNVVVADQAGVAVDSGVVSVVIDPVDELDDQQEDG